MENPIKALDERATLRLLIALVSIDKNLTSLLGELDGVGFNSLNKAIDILKDLKLIKEKESPYRIREFSLTDKGKEVAEIVLELKRKIEGE